MQSSTGGLLVYGKPQQQYWSVVPPQGFCGDWDTISETFLFPHKNALGQSRDLFLKQIAKFLYNSAKKKK